MSPFFWFGPICAIVALLFGLYLSLKILSRSEGTPDMVRIAAVVREAATAYIRQQFLGVSFCFVAFFLILLLLALYRMLEVFVPFAFLTGGFFSGLSGFIGVAIGVRSSARTTNAAKSSLNSALGIAFSSGMVMGLVVVGSGLLGLSLWYYFLGLVYEGLAVAERVEKVTSTMLGFGVGASFQALFARVSGGVFTKAADIGADLVGKIERGIPEDDPRNPAVIADQVGDNVGDIAGMGADLYESYIGSIVASMALSQAAGLREGGALLPMALAGAGILSSIVGSFFIRAKERADSRTLLRAMRRGIYGAAGLAAILSFFLTKLLLEKGFASVYWAILSGLSTGVLIGLSTEYFTSEAYPPTRGIAHSAKTQASTVVISGLSVGMLSTLPAIVIVAAGVIVSFYLSGGIGNLNFGLYGIGISAVGMLSTLGITLASDAYGPVADNAGGNAQMTNQPPIVRERTDALDALGNTTAATGKGFAIGSAALTSLALIAAYRNQVGVIARDMGAAIRELDLSLMNPKVVCGILIGAMTPYAFCSWIMRAVGRAAEKIVEEVRRQFQAIPGLLEGTAKPDYARAVRICVSSAQREMILPSLCAIITPILAGILLGAEGVAGVLVGALSSGFAVAIMMANSGGAWDNAKKYIEKGNLGGKGSEVHKAAVVGDTVGDPLKDAAGPSLNILIKLMCVVSILFLGFTLRFAILR